MDGKRRLQIDRQVLHKCGDFLPVSLMVVLNMLLDLGVELLREFCLVVETIEHRHLLLVIGRLLVDLVNVVRDGTAGHGESDDASKHDEDADDALSERSGGEIAVAHRCDRRDSEVDARHVQI